MGNASARQIDLLESLVVPLHHGLAPCVLDPGVTRKVHDRADALVAAVPGLARAAGLDVVVEVGRQAAFLLSEAAPVAAVVARTAEVGRDPHGAVLDAHAGGDDVVDAV